MGMVERKMLGKGFAEYAKQRDKRTEYKKNTELTSSRELFDEISLEATSPYTLSYSKALKGANTLPIWRLQF
jgi:hypothetical protein